jgi:membrane fusion protein (multidrug efflux system)
VGTGAAFSLLPAQNATGNWIKVVQRVPVRLALNASELAAHPLRVGLSMNVEIDVRQQDGKTLADAPRTAASASVQTLAVQDGSADETVRRVIAANLGKRKDVTSPGPVTQAQRPADSSSAPLLR